MTNMIEKMATAHYQNMSNRDLPYSLSWHKLTSNAKNNYMDDMRAAIEALRVPSDEMVEVLQRASSSREPTLLTAKNAIERWQAGVDAALGEQEKDDE